MTNKNITRTLKIARTGIYMAIVFALQFILLKFVPASITTTIITGSIVNMVLLLALNSVGFWSAALIGALTPVMAFLQGKLPLALLIPIVALSNIVIVAACFLVRKMFGKMGDAENNSKLWFTTETCGVVVGTLLKFAFMFISIQTYVPLFPGMKPPMIKTLSISWSFPQLIAGIVGGILAMLVYRGLLRAGVFRNELKRKKFATSTASEKVTSEAEKTVSIADNTDISGKK